MNRHGITLLSGVIFLALTISATVIVYEAGMPVVKRMQSAALIERMKDTFSELDKVIRQVATEGQGSKRTVYLAIDAGRFIVNETQNNMYWEFETDAPVMSPRTSQKFGNIRIGSNLNTKALPKNYTLSTPEIEAYVLENEHLKVYIRKIGSENSYASYSTSDLVLGIYQKDMDKWINNTGFVEILIDNEETSAEGNGYTRLLETGYNLPRGTVQAYMNSTYVPYTINFTLQSGTDFMEIGASI